MATFLKLLTKHKRPIRPLNIHIGSSYTKSTIHTSTALHIKSPINQQNITYQTNRYNSTTQTQTDTNPSNNNINTCINEARSPTPRGANRPNQSIKYSIGQIVDGDFTVTKITPIPSYECTAYEFLHNGTGARYIHLDTADTNNAFAVAFRTLPSDSTGVAHVLEHTVLCGSKNYPVRDPFFHMLKRSLNTFMNAMTSADWTCYPFATQNEQDYHNLLSVYLDSVFFPNLNELDFMQEGHRFEYENDELVYKGVVYNEMKGNMSDPNDIFAYNIQKNLFPNNLYQHNFGGNPPDIPKLTHKNLIDFHTKFYHPSNAVFYGYGDLGAQLNEINNLILSKFTKLDTKDIDESISIKQELFDAPKSIEAYTPEDAIIADPHQQSKICLSWICNDVNNFEDTFGLTVLSELLLSGPNAPFYQSLIKPNIGYGYASTTGYTMDTVQATFNVGLNNIKEEDIEKVENIILRTLKECVTKGFDSERIEAVLHQFEIDQKHRSGTFGLNLLFRMISLITHRVYDDENTPINALEIDGLLDNIRNKVLGDNPNDIKYFENLIEKYLVNNTHRISVVMKPDKEYMNKLENEEKQSLLNIDSALSDESKKLINEQCCKLLEYQENNKRNIEVLPTLKVSDIPIINPDQCFINTKQYEYNVYNELSDATSQINCDYLTNNSEITNDLSYFKILYDIEPLFPASSKGRIEDSDFNLILPLFGQCIGHMGAAEMNYKQLSQKIELKTGGVATEIHSLTPLIYETFETESININSPIDFNRDRLKYVLEINSYCLNRNIGNMLEILEDILLHPNYEYYERLETLIKDKVQSDITCLIESGHAYAIGHAASAYGRVLPSLKINEKLGGISQILFSGQLSNSLQGQRYVTLKELIQIFYDISYQLFKQQGPYKSLFVSDNESKCDLMAPFQPLDYYNHPNVFTSVNPNMNPKDYPKPVFGRKYNVLEPIFNSTNKFVDQKYKGEEEKSSKSKGETTDNKGGYKPISILRNYFGVPSQVNYCAGVIPTVPYNHSDCASLRVIAKILSLNYLHSEIREKGGAYGGGAAQNKNIFAFFSYRDPNHLKTINTFKQSIEWALKNENITGQDIDEALLSLFGNLDAPKSPQSKGVQELLQDIDENVRQTHREQLLSVNKESIRNALDKYLMRPFEENEVSFSIVGKQDIDQNEKDMLEENRFKYVTLG
eukprot:51264_1